MPKRHFLIHIPNPDSDKQNIIGLVARAFPLVEPAGDNHFLLIGGQRMNLGEESLKPLSLELLVLRPAELRHEAV